MDRGDPQERRAGQHVNVDFEYRRDGWWAFAYVPWMAKLFEDPSPVELGPFDTLAEAQFVSEQFRREIAQLPRCRRTSDWFLHSARATERTQRHGPTTRQVSE
jgi:hypothetical protein